MLELNKLEYPWKNSCSEKRKKKRSASEGKANSNDLEMTDKNNNIDDKIVRGYGEQALRNEAQAILDQIPFIWMTTLRKL